MKKNQIKSNQINSIQIISNDKNDKCAANYYHPKKAGML